eukprot:g1301.t1
MLPQRARVVVMGGGVIGTSVAYHLAKLGCSDVVLLEQASQLTAGTTWHAAGLCVTFGSMSETSTNLRRYSKKLYSEILEEETGQSTGFKGVGFIELATNADRLEHLRRVAAFNRKCGVDVHEISAAEVLKRFPLCRTDDVLAGFLVEDDGRVNPVDATMALARGAKMHGARIFQNVRVENVTVQPSSGIVLPRVTGVSTECGQTIEAEYVVNCTGMWARQTAEKAGVCVANQAAEHYYLITEPMSEVDSSWPVIEDPDSYTYIRPEAGGLMVGLFEGRGESWRVDGVPHDFAFGEIDPDWERMAPYLERAMSRVPASLEVGAKSLFCGPESFTHDGAPAIGEAPELRNYFVAAGMNSIGILSGGGVGRLIAQWILDGKPAEDVTGVNVDRMRSFHSTPSFRKERVEEVLGNVYKLAYPNKPTATCRNNKMSPLHSRLEAQGAYFGDVSGWESPLWYSPDRDPKELAQRLSFGREDWFDLWRQEHEACRNDVALFDMSFMSRFLVVGEDAGRLLNRLSTANVDQDDMITYTQWLNDDGCVEADVTVAKLAEQEYMVVATDTAHRHVEARIRRVSEDEGLTRAHVFDVTGGMAQINIQGPRSRELLEEVVNEDLEAFPFRGVRKLQIGYAEVNAIRITYVGELGFELFVGAEHAINVYDTLLSAGHEHGLRHAGLKALGSLRLEKGYRDYGHDVDATDSIAEAGLSFTCDFNKPDGFIGQEATLRDREKRGKKAPSKRLLSLKVLDPEPVLHHGEVLLRDGVVVGDVRAGSYGFTVGGAVGLAMVDSGGCSVNKKYIEDAEWKVDIGGILYPIHVSPRPLFDPKNLKIK